MHESGSSVADDEKFTASGMEKSWKWELMRRKEAGGQIRRPSLWSTGEREFEGWDPL